MTNDAENLFVAIEKAAGHRLDPDNPNDNILVQRGCYLLNRWGCRPRFAYPLFVGGPYSRDVADLFQDRRNRGDSTDVPDECIHRLTDLIGHGEDYLEAYTTLLLAVDDNPNLPLDSVVKIVKRVVPRLDNQISEASASLRFATSIRAA